MSKAATPPKPNKEEEEGEEPGEAFVLAAPPQPTSSQGGGTDDDGKSKQKLEKNKKKKRERDEAPSTTSIDAGADAAIVEYAPPPSKRQKTAEEVEKHDAAKQLKMLQLELLYTIVPNRKRFLQEQIRKLEKIAYKGEDEASEGEEEIDKDDIDDLMDEEEAKEERRAFAAEYGKGGGSSNDGGGGGDNTGDSNSKKNDPVDLFLLGQLMDNDAGIRRRCLDVAWHLYVHSDTVSGYHYFVDNGQSGANLVQFNNNRQLKHVLIAVATPPGFQVAFEELDKQAPAPLKTEALASILAFIGDKTDVTDVGTGNEIPAFSLVPFEYTKAKSGRYREQELWLNGLVVDRTEEKVYIPALDEDLVPGYDMPSNVIGALHTGLVVMAYNIMSAKVGCLFLSVDIESFMTYCLHYRKEIPRALISRYLASPGIVVNRNNLRLAPSVAENALRNLIRGAPNLHKRLYTIASALQDGKFAYLLHPPATLLKTTKQQGYGTVVRHSAYVFVALRFYTSNTLNPLAKGEKAALDQVAIEETRATNMVQQDTDIYVGEFSGVMYPDFALVGPDGASTATTTAPLQLYPFMPSLLTEEDKEAIRIAANDLIDPMAATVGAPNTKTDEDDRMDYEKGASTAATPFDKKAPVKQLTKKEQRRRAQAKANYQTRHDEQGVIHSQRREEDLQRERELAADDLVVKKLQSTIKTAEVWLTNSASTDFIANLRAKLMADKAKVQTLDKQISDATAASATASALEKLQRERRDFGRKVVEMERELRLYTNSDEVASRRDQLENDKAELEQAKAESAYLKEDAKPRAYENRAFFDNKRVKLVNALHTQTTLAPVQIEKAYEDILEACKAIQDKLDENPIMPQKPDLQELISKHLGPIGRMVTANLAPDEAATGLVDEDYAEVQDPSAAEKKPKVVVPLKNLPVRWLVRPNNYVKLLEGGVITLTEQIVVGSNGAEVAQPIPTETFTTTTTTSPNGEVTVAHTITPKIFVMPTLSFVNVVLSTPHGDVGKTHLGEAASSFVDARALLDDLDYLQNQLEFVKNIKDRVLADIQLSQEKLALFQGTPAELQTAQRDHSLLATMQYRKLYNIWEEQVVPADSTYREAVTRAQASVAQLVEQVHGNSDLAPVVDVLQKELEYIQAALAELTSAQVGSPWAELPPLPTDWRDAVRVEFKFAYSDVKEELDELQGQIKDLETSAANLVKYKTLHKPTTLNSVDGNIVIDGTALITLNKNKARELYQAYKLQAAQVPLYLEALLENWLDEADRQNSPTNTKANQQEEEEEAANVAIVGSDDNDDESDDEPNENGGQEEEIRWSDELAARLHVLTETYGPKVAKFSKLYLKLSTQADRSSKRLDELGKEYDWLTQPEEDIVDTTKDGDVVRQLVEDPLVVLSELKEELDRHLSDMEKSISILETMRIDYANVLKLDAKKYNKQRAKRLAYLKQKLQYYLSFIDRLRFLQAYYLKPPSGLQLFQMTDAVRAMLDEMKQMQLKFSNLYVNTWLPNHGKLQKYITTTNQASGDTVAPTQMTSLAQPARKPKARIEKDDDDDDDPMDTSNRSAAGTHISSFISKYNQRPIVTIETHL